ncbi:MAG: ATP-binding protein [Gammaproteobacteria bacterium]|nr:ATP-binding protein [Gammaproteobacteria bacterium]
MQSLQARLSTGLFVSLVTVFSALWLIININIQFLAEEYIASRLKHDADTLLNAISFDANDKLILNNNKIDQVYHQPFSGHYYLISTRTQYKQSRSLWDQQLKQINIATGEQLRTHQPGPEKQSLLVISSGYQISDSLFTISIAEDLNPIKENINTFLYWFALISLGMLVVLIALQAIILRYSLQPIIQIHTELKSLEQGQLDKLSTDSPRELRPLVNEVNHLLSVMEQRLRRSRNALSDLAHAIKKPLTVIQQVAINSNIPDGTKDTLVQQSSEILQLTDRILKRARLAGHSHSGALFSFAEDLPALIKTLDMIYTSKTLQLTINMPDNITCPIDREDMLELLGNLLDNAYKWANQHIIFSIKIINSALHICIEDDGPGVETDKIKELSQRGVRLDEKTAGHGFGLAIVADIVNSYGGHMDFNKSTRLGGFMTELVVPIQQA